MSERPVDDAADDQRPPDKHRLEGEARGVVEPASRLAADRDIVDRMVDIRRVDTQRVEREADARCIADMRDHPGRDHQSDGAGDFRDPGQQDDLFGIWHPVRCDLQKAARRPDMGDAGKQIKQCQQGPEKASCQAISLLGLVDQLRPMRATTVTKKAVDQPSRIKPLSPSIAATICHSVARPSLL